jgi:hypothetical protein
MRPTFVIEYTSGTRDKIHLKNEKLKAQFHIALKQSRGFSTSL